MIFISNELCIFYPQALARRKEQLYIYLFNYNVYTRFLMCIAAYFFQMVFLAFPPFPQTPPLQPHWKISWFTLKVIKSLYLCKKYSLRLLHLPPPLRHMQFFYLQLYISARVSTKTRIYTSFKNQFWKTGFSKLKWSAWKLLDCRILHQTSQGSAAIAPRSTRCASSSASRRNPLWKFLPTGLKVIQCKDLHKW